MSFLENKISADNILGDMYSTENIEVKQKGLQRLEMWEEIKFNRKYSTVKHIIEKRNWGNSNSERYVRDNNINSCRRIWIFKNNQQMLELCIQKFTEKEDTFTAFIAHFGHVIKGCDNTSFSPKCADNLWKEQ